LSGLRPVGPQAAQRVLVAEDVYLLARHLCDLLEDEGFEPVGPAPSAAKAIALIQTERLDAAVVDMRLAHGELAVGVCQALEAKAIPYLILTGWHVAPDLKVPVIMKPFDRKQLFAALRALLAAEAL